jgi:hypothetical protein
MGMIALTATLIINKGEKMKQTAIEWLFQRFEDGDMYNVEDAKFIKHQAKTMEKEQILDAHIEGQRVFDNYEHTQWTTDQAEQFYNETYKGGQDES